MKEKLGFFKKAKKAIFNFDEYSRLSNEKLSKSFGYLFILISIITILITISTTYRTYQIAQDTIEIFKSETPNFSITNGILTVENDQKFEYIDEDNYFGVIVDPTRETDENIDYSNGIIFSKDKIYMKNNGKTNEVSYNNLTNQDFQKSDIESILTKENLIKVYLILGGILLITNFIAYTIAIILNILTLSIIGMLVNWMAKTNLNYSKIFSMSIYAITLPVILLMIYTIITTLTDFTVKYFNIAYDIISYIYIITAILIMKSDLIKNKQELFVKEETKEIKKDINLDEGKKEEKKGKDKKEKEENKKEKEKNKNEEKNNNPGEPEGSKA